MSCAGSNPPFEAASTVEATYAYGRLLMAEDWRCSLATDCVVQQTASVADPSNYSRGQRLWAIKKAIDPTTRKISPVNACLNLLSGATSVKQSARQVA